MRFPPWQRPDILYPNRRCLRRIGNSIGTLLPAYLLRELGWAASDVVELKRVEGRLVIERISRGAS